MKLMGPHHHRKKDGSNNNSSRTSPARLEDAESVNSLLSTENDNLDDEGLQFQFIYILHVYNYFPFSVLKKKNIGSGRIQMLTNLVGCPTHTYTHTCLMFRMFCILELSKICSLQLHLQA